MFFFFFSSRRRHTRWPRDWSSDVCSSDLRHGSCGRSAGGGAGTRGRGARWHAGVPPFAQDGTERRIVRPQDPAEQTDSYSGKKKDHTVKNVLLINTPLTILVLSATYSGHVHDKRSADATPYLLAASCRISASW